MAAFCFYCGRVGHAEKNCAHRKEAVATNQLMEGQYGSWLRAESSPKRQPPSKPEKSESAPQSTEQRSSPCGALPPNDTFDVNVQVNPPPSPRPGPLPEPTTTQLIPVGTTLPNATTPSPPLLKSQPPGFCPPEPAQPILPHSPDKIIPNPSTQPSHTPILASILPRPFDLDLEPLLYIPPQQPPPPHSLSSSRASSSFRPLQNSPRAPLPVTRKWKRLQDHPQSYPLVRQIMIHSLVRESRNDPDPCRMFQIFQLINRTPAKNQKVNFTPRMTKRLRWW